jgi:hypothetical protein
MGKEMTKIKLRKRKRLLWFNYVDFKPLKYYDKTEYIKQIKTKAITQMRLLMEKE